MPVSPPGPSSNITGLVRVAPSAWSVASFSSPMAHLLVCDLPEGREWTVFICVSPASCPGTMYNKYLWEERHGQVQGNLAQKEGAVWVPWGQEIDNLWALDKRASDTENGRGTGLGNRGTVQGNRLS